jgi:hypothetical protein
MTIKISMAQEKWRIEINEEVWEFPDKEEFGRELKDLLDKKEEYGRLKRC